MDNMPETQTDSSKSAMYQIRVNGHLGHQWADWFDGMHISQEDNGDSILTGPIRDQAALYGLLKKIRDLGLPLLALTLIDHTQTSNSADKDSSITRRD
jgi:hypothetical protein